MHTGMSVKNSILGLGIMGAGMARSAARGGLDTTAWDRWPERASSFAAPGIQIAQSARPRSRGRDRTAILRCSRCADTLAG